MDHYVLARRNAQAFYDAVRYVVTDELKENPQDQAHTVMSLKYQVVAIGESMDRSIVSAAAFNSGGLKNVTAAAS